MHLRLVSLFAMIGLVGIILLTFLVGVDGRIEAVDSSAIERSSESKWGCVACTMVTGLVTQLMETQKMDAEGALNMFCNLFAKGESLMCKMAKTFLWEKAIPLLNNNESPDVICLAIGYCFNPTCHLFPLKIDKNEVESHVHKLRVDYKLFGLKTVGICTFFSAFCRTLHQHLPFWDFDGDLFSTVRNLRGSNWRGRDCNEISSRAFPGRATLDVLADENCNGIYGVDSETGKPYEELWCSSEHKPMGIISVGDSATAHFGIPGNLLNVTELAKFAVQNFSSILENEFDWPMLSWSTGFLPAEDFAPNRKGETKSVYSEFLKRNRCNHRDYQNIAVNGATTKLLSTLMDTVARNRTSKVKPALVFFSMIGNDVCTFPATTPSDYYNNIMIALDKANDRLPEGSHVFIFPVSDGRILYNVMHNRTHPIGSLHNDVTYANFYDFLNCVDVSPCPGWMNTDDAVRENTFKIVQTLNAQIPLIIEHSRKKHKVIKAHFIGDVVQEVLRKYKGNLWDLIERVDGFHPSQKANALLGEHIAQKIEALGCAPPVNPFNDAIEKRFGDQGGH